MNSYEDPNQTPSGADDERQSRADAPAARGQWPAAEGWRRPAGILPPAAMASLPPSTHTATADRPARRVRRLAVAGVAAVALVAGGGFAGAAAVHSLDRNSTPAAASTSVATVADRSSIADVVAAVDQEVV